MMVMDEYGSWVGQLPYLFDVYLHITCKIAQNTSPEARIPRRSEWDNLANSRPDLECICASGPIPIRNAPTMLCTVFLPLIHDYYRGESRSEWDHLMPGYQKVGE